MPSAPPNAAAVRARLVAQWLSEHLGQQFIIDNRPGAATNIGTDLVAHAPADGYTLLLAGSPAAINATLYDNLNFNFVRDIAPVASIERMPLIMAVNPALRATTVPQFIDYAKANPGKINMGSGGVGSTGHVAGELFAMMAGLKIAHVPYRGEAPALTDPSDVANATARMRPRANRAARSVRPSAGLTGCSRPRCGSASPISATPRWSCSTW